MSGNKKYLTLVLNLYEFIRTNFVIICTDKIKSELALQFLINTD